MGRLWDAKLNFYPSKRLQACLRQCLTLLQHSRNSYRTQQDRIVFQLKSMLSHYKDVARHRGMIEILAPEDAELLAGVQKLDVALTWKTCPTAASPVYNSLHHCKRSSSI